MRWQMVIGAIVVLVIYVVVGGIIFWLLETHTADGILERSVTKLSEKDMTIISIHRELVAQLMDRLRTTSVQGLFKQCCS